ncbi:MAG: hypothetical protein M1511_09950 [Deltaproteobacteria bacterium]|nr:hypothetical protein [Deltaproteobacteria bacterium]
MKLIIKPSPRNRLFGENQQIVMSMEQEGRLEVFYKEGMASPDRHFLVSLAQMALFAIEENDSQFVDHLEQAEIEAHKEGNVIKLSAGLVIVQSTDGKFAALTVGDPLASRKLARNLVRSLTGRIRLDVP